MTDEHATEQAIRDPLDRMVAAWKAADPAGYGDAFTEDARYIAFFGGVYRGRQEIAASHRVLWASALAGTQIFHEELERRIVAPDVAIVVTRGDVARQRPKRLAKVQSYVVVRDGARWRIAHFQNTKRLGLMRFLTYRAGPDAIPSLDR